jgi:hypothetical protein
MKKLILLTFLALFPALAQAQVQTPMSAHALQKMCDSRYDIDVGICAGYITAIAEMVQQESSPGRRVCLSPAISPQTLMEHVQKYWAANPPNTQDLASFNVDQALRDRFRCQ